MDMELERDLKRKDAGSEWLDRRVALASGLYRQRRGKQSQFYKVGNRTEVLFGVPPFTTSIDAAFTLIDGWAFVAKRHLLATVAEAIHADNLDPAVHMPRLICLHALDRLGGAK